MAGSDDYASLAKPRIDWDDQAARAALVDARARDAHAVLEVLQGRSLPAAVAQAARLLALAVHVEDLQLTPDDEHLGVLGKGGRRRTALLDDPRLVAELRGYLKATGYRHGPLFCAAKNGRGGPLRYQSVQERWAGYCAAVGVTVTLHQLRQAHATELVNDGVSLATIRKRLGHKNLQTTARYANQSDATADAELRAWRRRRDQHSG